MLGFEEKRHHNWFRENGLLKKKIVEWKDSGTYQVAFVFSMWEIEWDKLEKDFKEYKAEVVSSQGHMVA